MRPQATTTARHCTHDWCDIASNPEHDEHFSSEYVPVTRSGPYRTTLTVGAGVLVTDGPDTSPSIYVHINSGDDEVDEDAYMSIDEAVDLVDALISAISHAWSVDV